MMSFADEFLDIEFPSFLSFGARVKIKYKTSVIRMREGSEQRVAIWQDAQREYNITPALRNQADLDELLAFFQTVHGPRFIFKIRDPVDFTLGDTVTGSGDQIFKVYATGLPGDSYATLRPIQLLDSDNPGTFFVPVRFAEMRMATSVEVYKKFEWQVRLIEARVPTVSDSSGVETAPPESVDAVLPSSFTDRSSFGPQWDVVSIDADSGELRRIPQFPQSVFSGSMLQEIRPEAAMKEFLTFFHARRGRLIGFRCQNLLTGGTEIVRFATDEVEVSVDGFEVYNWTPVALAGYNPSTGWQPAGDLAQPLQLAPDCGELSQAFLLV